MLVRLMRLTRELARTLTNFQREHFHPSWRRASVLCAGCLAAVLAGGEGRAERFISPGTWSAAGHVASAPPMIVSDGQPASLNVVCRDGEAWPVLRHSRLGALPQVWHEDTDSPWHGVVTVLTGWGLDLRRSDHHGAQSYWRRCAGVAGCLVSAPLSRDWVVSSLMRNFSVYIRLELETAAPVDMRVSLTGSASAIRNACGGEPRPYSSWEEAISSEPFTGPFPGR